jgi:hypothetical protein
VRQFILSLHGVSERDGDASQKSKSAADMAAAVDR